MIMNKIIFGGILFLVLAFIPNVSLASWWNPASWFSSEESYQVAPQPTSFTEAVTPPADPLIVESPTPDPIEAQVIEKVIEKPVVKTITVQDPSLQAKIDSLLSENTSLKLQVANLKASNNSLNSELVMCENAPDASVSSEECLTSKEEVVDLRKDLSALQAQYKKDYDLLVSNPSGAFGGGLAQEVQMLDKAYKPKEDTLYSKISTAQAEVQLYCD